MRPCSAATVERIIRKYQKRLRLEDWDIYYNEFEPPENPDECASISHNNENFIARLRIGWVNMDDRVNTLEQTIAHELAHLHVWKLRMLAYDLIENYVFDMQAQKVYAKLLEEHEERIVERIAWIVVKA